MFIASAYAEEVYLKTLVLSRTGGDQLYDGDFDTRWPDYETAKSTERPMSKQE
jgi:hypothetical protein